MKAKWSSAVARPSALARLIVLGAVLPVLDSGCGAPPPQPVEVIDEEARLAESIPINLSEWLGKSRAELAVLAEDWAKTLDKQRDKARAETDSVELLPNLHAPVGVPVLNRAVYSPTLKMSLPPYLKEGSHDNELAFHLARYGDVEGGLRLGDPAVRTKLEAMRSSRNYPIEWTRLVALAQQSATLKMASGDIEGASLLVHLHRQLREVLDEKAVKGSLGQVLLPTGKHALTQAAAAWKAPGHNKPNLVNDIETALNAWGPTPLPSDVLPPGTPRETVHGILGGVAQNHTVTVLLPDPLARALDLLTLPVPVEGVQTLVAFLDPNDKLNSLLLVYRSKVDSLYPEPTDLAYPLVEQGAKAQEPSGSPNVLRQCFTLGDRLYEATRLVRGSASGALVQVSAEKWTPYCKTTPAGRDYGPVSLDRTFEADRLRVAREQLGAKLTVNDPKLLANMAAPLHLPVPSSAQLQREVGHDLVGYLTVQWPAGLTPLAAQKLLPVLWSAFGSSKLEGFDDHLLFSWEDSETRLKLRLPFSDNPAELVAEDVRGPKAFAARAEAAVVREAAERKARLEAGKPLDRLERSFETVNGLSFGFVKLGATRADIEKELPRTTMFRKRAIPNGLSLFFTGNPPGGVRFWARQMFILFDAAGRVGEIRVRYSDLSKGSKGPALLDSLEAQKGADGPAGKPEVVSPEWDGLWRDLPKAKAKLAKYRWQDDDTIVTCQADAGIVEVTRRDRPAERPDGVDLPLVVYAPGVGRCLVGAPREDVLKAMRTASDPATGSETFRAPADSPYQHGMFWTENGKVKRVVAAHKAGDGKTRDAAQMLVEAWTRELDKLGYVCRVEQAHGLTLGAYFWHDDKTRVRLFVQDTEEGPRVFTEWLAWPLPEKKSVAGR
jgi:hypothetical protein